MALYLLILSVLGDPRTNQNPAILAIGIMFFRYHNVIAGKVQQRNPTWTDEEIFQRTRRLVIASLQVNNPLQFKVGLLPNCLPFFFFIEYRHVRIHPGFSG